MRFLARPPVGWVGKPPILLTAAGWIFCGHLFSVWLLRQTRWWWGSYVQHADTPIALAFKIKRRQLWAPPLIGWYLNHWLVISLVLFGVLLVVTYWYRAFSTRSRRS